MCPCQLFVRLRYRVSDVLGLSLVSKWFGFWTHITHVIVLTFKEIMHLSDYRTVGPSDYKSDPMLGGCYSRNGGCRGHDYASRMFFKV